MIEQAGIANFSQALQNQGAKRTAQSQQASANFIETFKNMAPKVAVLENNTAAELNFKKSRFEDLWEDPDEKLFENPYDEIAKIFRKYLKKK